MTTIERITIWPIGIVILAVGFCLYGLFYTARGIAALADRLTGSREPPNAMSTHCIRPLDTED